MANSPPALAGAPAAPGAGNYRVTRRLGIIMDAVVTAANPAAAKAAARLLTEKDWRAHLPSEQPGQDNFEYNVVAPGSDDGA